MPSIQWPAQWSRQTWWRLGATAGGAALLTLLGYWASPPPRRGEELLACGQYFPVGTPVVLWFDPGGYDAYQRQKRFLAEPQPDGALRYDPLRGDLPVALAAKVKERGWRLDELRSVVHTFVLHFDTCGASRRCFEVLQDQRTLSVHFLLDVDGTIYQTLDTQERAWHATIANSCSIGVEIAHPGCFPAAKDPGLSSWYVRDAEGWRLQYPRSLTDPGVRTVGFVPRPERQELVSGFVHGKEYWQFDYTEQQYHALAHLCAALARTFPRIRLEVPRNQDGSVRTTQLDANELRAFDGIIGHFHVQANKTDPGPALQWDRLLAEARSLLAAR